MHMALDEVLLEEVIGGRRPPTLRLLEWVGPPLAIGSPHSMEVDLVPRLIRLGRERIAARGVRSAEKSVSPLSWFTKLSCDEVDAHLHSFFAREFGANESTPTSVELESASRLVASKYGDAAWINRLP